MTDTPADRALLVLIARRLLGQWPEPEYRQDPGWVKHRVFEEALAAVEREQADEQLLRAHGACPTCGCVCSGFAVEREQRPEETPTDTERLDFLQRQGFTRWVGYGTPQNHAVWPVFPGEDLRTSIDYAIQAARRCHARLPETPR